MKKNDTNIIRMIKDKETAEVKLGTTVGIIGVLSQTVLMVSLSKTSDIRLALMGVVIVTLLWIAYIKIKKSREKLKALIGFEHECKIIRCQIKGLVKAFGKFRVELNNSGLDNNIIKVDRYPNKKRLKANTNIVVVQWVRLERYDIYLEENKEEQI